MCLRLPPLPHAAGCSAKTEEVGVGCGLEATTDHGTDLGNHFLSPDSIHSQSREEAGLLTPDRLSSPLQPRQGKIPCSLSLFVSSIKHHPTWTWVRRDFIWKDCCKREGAGAVGRCTVLRTPRGGAGDSSQAGAVSRSGWGVRGSIRGSGPRKKLNPSGIESDSALSLLASSANFLVGEGWDFRRPVSAPGHSYLRGVHEL